MKRPRIEQFLTVICIALLHSGLLYAQSLTEADNALFNHDVQRAYELYEVIATNAVDPEIKAEAQLKLATLDWRFYKRTDSARSILLSLSKSTAKQSEALVELARMETRSGGFKAARAAAARALMLAGTSDEIKQARIRFAAAVVEEAVLALLAAGPGRQGPAADHRSRLQDAAIILDRIISAETGLLEPSRLLLAAGILLGDGSAALKAWRSYYRVAPGENFSSILAGPQAVLEEILPSWEDRKLSPENRKRLIIALADSRFFSEAKLLALETEVTHTISADVKDIIAYAGFASKIESLTDEHYGKMALGEGDEESYLNDFLREAVALLEELSWPSGKPEILDPAAEDPTGNLSALGELISTELHRRFGATINLGRTAGYFDLHYGHAVIDEERVVEQYGQRAAVRFIQLDGIVSNGFQSWAWDYRSQHGGWANKDGIFQIRPAYADGPLDAWRRLTEAEARKEWEDRIAAFDSDDKARALQNQYSYFPGLAGRLRLSALEQLRSRLRKEGFEDAALRTQFLAEYERIVQEYSIFAHEGRHAIDKQLGFTDAEELEFRAKLSQITFTELPKLALTGGIISSDIGSDSPHGRANLRIVKGLATWMENHTEDIEGLDRSLPLLPQLDLLTDDQIRDAARSLDPLAM